LIFENVEESQNYVFALKTEVIATNPESHIDYLLKDDLAFQRIFVSFKSCIQGFKMSCRPFLGVDGYHLRSKYLGTLLSATAIDENNGLFLMASAVVKGESEVTWTWFLEYLKEAVETDLENITIISDQEKGLQEILGCYFYIQNTECV